jgi:tetratricopeptide (TPR) repeat protein
MINSQLRVSRVCLALAALALAVSSHASPQSEMDAAELDRQRLIAAAHYENDDFKAAAKAFRRCLELAPSSAEDHFNLALTLMRDTEYDEALRILEKVEDLDPGLLGVHYVRGIVYKNQERLPEAVESLKHVIESDPQCFGAFYNLGVCYKKMKDDSGAREAFEAAIRLDPQHPSTHYQVITLARRMGDVEAANRHAEIFYRVKDTIDEAEKTAEALERSRYSNIISVPRLGRDLEPAPEAQVRFADMTEDAGLLTTVRAAPAPPLPALLRRADYDEEEARKRWVTSTGGAVALGDADRDGDLDLFVANCASTPALSANRLYINDGGGRFTDVTEAFGLGDDHRAMDAIFGDYDNDGHDDLYVVNDGPNLLYRKQGDGVYEASGEGGDGAKGLSVVAPPGPLPVAYTIELEFESLYVDGQDQNGFLIFDYRGPDQFKFAGARVADGYWTIGRYDGSWVDEARLEHGITTEKVYRLHVRIDGGTVTFLPEGPAGEKRLSHDFEGRLDGGRIGLAVERASARFDNLRIGVATRDEGGTASGAPGRYLYMERFSDGRADGFEEISGTWRVADWAFEDVSVRARANEPQLGRKALFVDYDHDNDLDIYVANDAEFAEPPGRDELALPQDLPGQANSMLRNNGNGTFDDQTDEAGLLVDLSQSRDVLFADFEGDNDIDLFVANADHPSLLFTNLRMSRFSAGGRFRPPLEAGVEAAAAGDFNRDGRIDLLIAAGDRVLLYTNSGRAEFEGRRLSIPGDLTPAGVGAMEILDYNNDGWPDLLLASTDGKLLRLMAGAGPAGFRDVSARVGLDAVFGLITDLAVGDIDGDGDMDILLMTRDAGPRLLVNQGGNRRHWLRVRPVGKKVNRNGYGATVEIAAEGHYQKQVVREGPVHFGLGRLEGVDVVRITWPNGVVQNLVAHGIDRTLSIDEHVKVSASCGFLWANDGTGFKLINEILGIGALGAPIAPGVYHQPDHTELIKIDANQLAPRDGFYELRLTEELREMMYVDRIALRVVDHPEDLEIVPNEMFKAPPFPEEKFYAVAGARPPRSAIDDRGRDVLDLIRRRDGRFPTFPLVPRYDGLAEPHSLTLDLGDLSGAERIVLYLDGWIYWPEASTTIALAQDPRYGIEPFALQVRDERGRWQTAIESIGLPTSKGLVVPVELTGLFPARDYHVRLTANMRIYLDRIFISTRDEPERCRVTELPVGRADLHYRGFSALRRDRIGYERFDYDDVSPTGSWSPPEGMFTRYGDVAPLLSSPENKYVIFGPGDELTLLFEAQQLPELPGGWTRDFIFYADGWVKDGDLNTKHSETVEPLPFHGMSGYPYPDTERYPDTPELAAYRAEYNTRPGVPTVGRLSRAGRTDE